MEKANKINRSYSAEYKAGAVKLAREIGKSKAGSELGVPYGTLSGWMDAAEHGDVDTGKGTQTPQTALTQAAEIQLLKAELKKKEKEVKQLKQDNDFLEKAAAFFAASRQKSGKTSE